MLRNHIILKEKNMQSRHFQLFKQIEKDIDKTDELKHIPNLIEASLPYCSFKKGFITDTLTLTFTDEKSLRAVYDAIKIKPEVYKFVVFDRCVNPASVEVRGINYADIITMLQKLYPVKSIDSEEKTPSKLKI